MSGRSYIVRHTVENHGVDTHFVLHFNSNGGLILSVQEGFKVKRYFTCALNIVEDTRSLKRLVFIQKDEEDGIGACVSIHECSDGHTFMVTCNDGEGEVYRESFNKTYKKLVSKTKGSFKEYADISYWQQPVKSAA